MSKPKGPTGAWIVEQREAREWKSEELARRLGVADSTVRNWEAGSGISRRNRDALERLFGRELPGGSALTGQADLSAALFELARELTAMRDERADLRRELAEARADRDLLLNLRETVKVLAAQSLPGSEGPGERTPPLGTTG